MRTALCAAPDPRRARSPAPRSWIGFPIDAHGIPSQARTFRVHAASRTRVERPLVGGTGDDVVAEYAGRQRVREVGALIPVGDQLPFDVAEHDVDGAEFGCTHL